MITLMSIGSHQINKERIEKMKKTLLNTTMNRSTTFTVKNRFYKAAMSETMATKSNNPTEELVKLYGRWAQGGAGLLMTGNVMIDREALGEPGNVVIEDERDLDILKDGQNLGRKMGHSFGCKSIIPVNNLRKHYLKIRLLKRHSTYW